MKHLKVLSLVAISFAFVACAAKLPQADVTAATTAYTDAQTALADQFAPDSWKAATDANTALQANLTAKEYGKTKVLAKTLLDASTKAKADAATGLETAKTDCTTLMSDINTIAPAIKAQLALATKAGKKGAAAVKAYKPAVAGIDAALKTAQASLDSGAVLEAKNALTTLKSSLTEAQAAFEAAGFKK